MQKNTLSQFVVTKEGQDFWAALRVPPRCQEAGHLRRAIALGKAGKSDAAYAALVEYHRVTLAKEWELTQQSVRQAKRPAPQELRDLLNHKIPTWHHQVIQFGAKIDWLPESLAWDSQHGFHYMFWLSPAVTAFIQTGEARYRDFLNDILQQYCFDVPRHPRWESVLRPMMFSGLGVAGKWPIFLRAYLALIQEKNVSRRTVEGVTRFFLDVGRALNQQFHEFNRESNQYAVSLCTWLHIARLFPEFRDSVRWDRTAVEAVARYAKEAYFADGGNPERVWGYGVMHLRGLADSFRVAQRYGGFGRHQKAVLKTIRTVCQWYAKTVTPSPGCFFPTYGDAGWKGHDQFASVRSMVKNIPGLDDPFFGVDRSRSYLLKPSGFAILRNGDRPDSSYVNVSFGKFAGWHSHWDLLSLNFWAQGEPLLEEHCRFGPYENPLDTLFRAPESHNLVLIDGMIYDSRDVEGQDVAWYANDALTYFSATHRAYRYFVFGREGTKVSPNIEALVRRTVLMVNDPGYVLVLDSVGDINHPTFNRAISQYWHSPQPFRVIRPGLARTAGKTACLMAWTQPESLHRLEPGVDFTEREVADLGHAYDRYSLRARRWMPLAHKGISGFTTLLYPFQGKLPRVSIRTLPSTGGAMWKTEAVEIVTPRGRDQIVLNPERMKGLVHDRKPILGRGSVKLGNGRGGLTIP